MLIAILLIVAGVTALSHVAPFPFILDVVNKDVSVWRMPAGAGARTIYLTFDDGPNSAATPELLDLLKKKGVRATFFLIDAYVNGATAPIVRRMFEEEHAVGLHSADRWLLLRSPDDLAASLREAADRIAALTGRRPCAVFRPHAGMRSVRMMRGVRRSGYKLVGWSWMTWDWVWFRTRTGPRVASHVLSNVEPGKIIVIHDGHHRNPRADRQYAIEATERIIDELVKQSYQFATFCQTT
jgi:peptidoglycan/xylan/chitin deacetylase (PgdA/CDA1 family)